MNISTHFVVFRWIWLVLYSFGMTGLYCSSIRVEETWSDSQKGGPSNPQTLQFQEIQILLRILISLLNVTEKTKDCQFHWNYKEVRFCILEPWLRKIHTFNFLGRKERFWESVLIKVGFLPASEVMLLKCSRF
jgi:hypothetical protein